MWVCGDCQHFPCEVNSGRVKTDWTCELFKPHDAEYTLEDKDGDYCGDICFTVNENKNILVEGFDDDRITIIKHELAPIEFKNNVKIKSITEIIKKSIESKDIRVKISTKELKFPFNDVQEMGWFKEIYYNFDGNKAEPTPDIEETKEETRLGIYEENLTFAQLSDVVIKKNPMIYIVEMALMYIYKDGIYVKDTNDMVLKKLLYDVCYTRNVDKLGNPLPMNNRLRAECLEYVRMHTCVSIEKIDNNNNWIVVRNGILDIYTGELKNHNPNHISLTKFDVEYNPHAACPNFDMFIDSLFVDNKTRTKEQSIELVHEWFGYVLMPHYPYSKSLLLVGEGGNGKSTLLNILTHFIGDGKYASLPLQSISDPHDKFTLSALYNKYANICGDMGDARIDDAGGFKKATGGDPIETEYKYGTAFRFRSRAKLCYGVNKVPESNDTSTGFMRRWIILEFNKRFFGKSEVSNMTELCTTDEELSGILNKALWGISSIRKNNGFQYADSINDATEKWMNYSRVAHKFVDDMITAEDHAFISKDDLYAEFIIYCDKNHLPKMNKIQFGKDFNKACREHNIKKTASKRKGVNVWKGISIYNNPEDSQELLLDKVDVALLSEIETNLKYYIDFENLHKSSNTEIREMFTDAYPEYKDNQNIIRSVLTSMK